MHFGENQLSRSLIGLSPLSTGHPPGFQPWWVRSSTRSYPRFNLPMDRSLRFGSWSRDYGRPVRTRFRYGFPTRVNLATQRKLAGSFFKRHAVTSHEDSLRRIVGTWFQVLFHSPPGVLFTFPSRYLSAIGHQGVFRLSGWSRQIHTEFQGFRVTWGDVAEPSSYVYGGITLYAGTFQSASTSTTVSYSVLARQCQPDGPTTPHTQRLPAVHTCVVWPISDFARHYSRNHCCFLFLWVLRCFTSPRSLQLPYVFRQR